jgi:hypothetical protein
MPEIDESRQERALRVYTTRGCLEGRIQTSPMVRTLDDLNVVARHLVTLHGARALSGDWSLESGAVALAKSAILYVFELDQPAPQSSVVKSTARFFRSPVRLWLSEYSIRGFVHVPAGGSAMARFNQQTHAFIAVTSASVVGPGTEMAVPFLAVNREHIVAAEEIRDEEPVEEEESAAAIAFEVLGADE